jgi:hypothetical protein
VDKLRRGCGLTLLVVACLISGAAIAVMVMLRLERSSRAEQQEYVMNGGPPIRPVWLRQPRACEPPTPFERRRDEAMAQVALTSLPGHPRDPINPMLSYAVKYFSWHWSLLRFNRCAPEQDYIDALLPALDATDWPQVNTQGNELRLVERMPRSARLAKALAAIAFSPLVPPREAEPHDSRPYARMLLGDQGEFARPWAVKARSEISGDTKLGTSAAYLAVAADARAALPQVQAAMAAKLRSSLGRQVATWKDKGEANAIRSDDADRLIELAYALAKAGPAADPYGAPILQALDHGIARAAPPFGLLFTKPTELCRAAAWIGGRTGQIAGTNLACVDPKGGDGRPIDYP